MRDTENLQGTVTCGMQKKKKKGKTGNRKEKKEIAYVKDCVREI